MNALLLFRGSPHEQGRPYRARALQRNPEVLNNRILHVNRRSLKFPPNSEAIDLGLVEPSQVRVHSKFYFASIGFGTSRYKIQHCALSGSVGTDDDAQLSLIEVKV